MIATFKKLFVHTSPSIKAFAVFSVFILLALLVPSIKITLDVNGVLAAASIFYSILLGFYIAAAMANLSRLKTLVATETGALIAIFNIVKLSLPQNIDETKQNIDAYLLKRFDYEIDSYTEPTTVEFFNIFGVLKGAEGKSAGESAAINYIAEAMYYIAQTRRELTVVGARVVDSASWLILNILSLVIVISLFFIRDGSWQSALITALLSSSATLALFILDDVDANRFGEEQFAIDTYQDVFSAIGKLHYYPKHYLIGGRYKPLAKTYRTGSSNEVSIVNS